MKAFPQNLAEAEMLTGKERRAFGKILRTRFIDQESGAFIMRGHEKEGDPFWADVYDGRFGHVIFGHTPFKEAPHNLLSRRGSIQALRMGVH